MDVEARFDTDRLKAEHPSWRLFRAHPALGLEETDHDYVDAVGLAELGLRWLALEPAEQRAREADFLRALLERAARHPDTRFEAIPRRGETAAALAQRTGATGLEDGAVLGSFTPAAVEALLRESPGGLVVDHHPELAVVTMSESFEDLAVWTDRWRTAELERELTDAWWEPAQRRREMQASTALEVRRRTKIDRATKARVLLAWKRAGKAVLVLAAGSAAWWPLLGSEWLDALMRVVVAVAVLIALDTRIERWYRRDRVKLRAGGP